MPSFRFSKADEAVVEVLEGATDSMESVITTMVEFQNASTEQLAARSCDTQLLFFSILDPQLLSIDAASASTFHCSITFSIDAHSAAAQF